VAFLTLRLQPIAQRYQLTYLHYDSLLLSERRQRERRASRVVRGEARQIHPITLGHSVLNKRTATKGVAKINGIDEAKRADRNNFGRAVSRRIRNKHFVQVGSQLSI
jgi:hypothetical protein